MKIIIEIIFWYDCKIWRNKWLGANLKFIIYKLQVIIYVPPVFPNSVNLTLRRIDSIIVFVCIIGTRRTCFCEIGFRRCGNDTNVSHRVDNEIAIYIPLFPVRLN